MGATTGSLVPVQGKRRSLDRLVVFAIVLSVASAAVGVSSVMRSDAFRGSPLDDPQVAETSFGSLTVNGGDLLGGLTSQDLAGVTHGIGGLVLSDKAQAQVTVTLRNDSDQAFVYTPEMFRMREGSAGMPIAPTGSGFEGGVIPAGTSIDLLLDFVVGRTGADLLFEFSDPGRAQPVVIPVGSIAPAQDTGDGHGHESSAP
jgi:hypothetical protein